MGLEPYMARDTLLPGGPGRNMHLKKYAQLDILGWAHKNAKLEMQKKLEKIAQKIAQKMQNMQKIMNIMQNRGKYAKIYIQYAKKIETSNMQKMCKKKSNMQFM